MERVSQLVVVEFTDGMVLFGRGCRYCCNASEIHDRADPVMGKIAADEVACLDHVVNDDRCFASNGSALPETLHEQGHQDRQTRRLHRLQWCYTLRQPTWQTKSCVYALKRRYLMVGDRTSSNLITVPQAEQNRIWGNVTVKFPKCKLTKQSFEFPFQSQKRTI